MEARRCSSLTACLVVVGVLPVTVALCARQAPATNNWKTCRDAQHGFSVRYPPDWQNTGPVGRCAQFRKGQSALPEGIPEVDISLRVTARQGMFPDDYLRDKVFPVQERAAVSRSVTYSDRQELQISGLPAVRAAFTSSGPTPNWGVEYAIQKGGEVLNVYISQPTPEIAMQFEAMIKSLRW